MDSVLFFAPSWDSVAEFPLLRRIRLHIFALRVVLVSVGLFEIGMELAMPRFWDFLKGDY